jgi:formylglycine-generating enzyme
MISRILFFLVLFAVALVGCKKKDYNAVPKASSKTGLAYAKEPTATDAGGDAFGPVRYGRQATQPGLTFVEGGTFHMGGSEKDAGDEMNNRERQVTVHSFYMDVTEVANVNWREFLFFVDDTLKDFMKPDTSVWFRDLAYNEPFIEYYFQHPAFNMYPVVGVTWYQCNEYCKWRTGKIYEQELKNNPNANLYPFPRYRLPTEAEWEYAARGLLEQELYPWEGKSLRNSKGVFNANFKRGRGDFAGRSNQGGSNLVEGLNDGYMIPGPVESFHYPNDFGLYHMAGNVAEWTFDTYRVLAYEDVEDFQPFRRRGEVTKDQLQDDNNYGEKVPGVGKNRFSLLHTPYDATRSGKYYNPNPSGGEKDHDRVKVYRGGSWSDVAYYLSCGTRRYFMADSSASNLGFRCAMSRVGSPSNRY